MSEKKNKSFEDEMKRLEEIVSIISSQSVGLEESIKLFEEGEALSKSISEKLKEYEGKIMCLNENTKKFEDMDGNDA